MKKRDIIKCIKAWLKRETDKQDSLCPFDDYHDQCGSLPHKTCNKYFIRKIDWSPCPCHNYDLKYVVRKARQIIKELEVKDA